MSHRFLLPRESEAEPTSMSVVQDPFLNKRLFHEQLMLVCEGKCLCLLTMEFCGALCQQPEPLTFFRHFPSRNAGASIWTCHGFGL